MAGVVYQIDLEGADTTGAGTLRNPEFYGIYKPDGITLVPDSADSNSGDNKNSQKTYTAEETGTYFLDVGGKNNMIGTYTLTVTTVP